MRLLPFDPACERTGIGGTVPSNSVVTARRARLAEDAQAISVHSCRRPRAAALGKDCEL
jgi:hypothetical protein